MKRCFDCMYWDRDPVRLPSDDENDPDSLEGMCRRYPPAFVPTGDLRGIDDVTSFIHWGQPVSQSEDWCGEWVRRELLHA